MQMLILSLLLKLPPDDALRQLGAIIFNVPVTTLPPGLVDSEWNSDQQSHLANMRSLRILEPGLAFPA